MIFHPERQRPTFAPHLSGRDALSLKVGHDQRIALLNHGFRRAQHADDKVDRLCPVVDRKADVRLDHAGFSDGLDHKARIGLFPAVLKAREDRPAAGYRTDDGGEAQAGWPGDREARKHHRRSSPTHNPESTVSPAVRIGVVNGPARRLPPTGAQGHPIPQSRNAALSDRVPSLPAIVLRDPSQGRCNLFRLSGGFGVAAPCGLLEPVEAPVRHPSARKVDKDDLGHSLFSKSGEPVRPASVSQ